MKIPGTKTQDRDETISPDVEIMEAGTGGAIMSPEQIKDELIKSVSPDVLQSLSLALSRSEDYTSEIIENRTVEDMSPIITTLIEVIKQNEETKEIDVLQDDKGIWLDAIGTKGIIPPGLMPYNQQANFSAIFTSLQGGVYRVTYEYNDDGSVKRDEKGEPVIKKREPVNMGTAWRNLNQLCNLAYSGNSRNLQAKIFAGVKGTSPIGFDERWDNVLTKMFEGGKK